VVQRHTWSARAMQLEQVCDHAIAGMKAVA
jgi:hypothetical protein